MIGEVVGSYRIIEKIATGGMGVVYKAEHTLIGKTAAVKVLRREYSEDRPIMERFFREAQATTAIRHPGIVDIYDFGYHQNERAYIIMEYLAGETLKDRLKARGIFAPDAAIRMVRSVAGAVGAAHEQGVVHRDLKPDNILLVPDPDMPDGERIKVLDFGLAKLTDAQSATMGTQAGLVLGTPAYMAPEQCSGQGQIDIRADIYALGCILFQLVCGRPPFQTTGGFARILMAHMHEPPQQPRAINGAIPEGLEQIILKLLAKSPDDRLQTMAAVRQALDACADGASELPVAVLIESADDAAGTGASSAGSGQRRGLGHQEPSHVSTLGASTGQIMASRSQVSAHGGPMSGSSPGSMSGSSPGSVPGSSPGSMSGSRPGGSLHGRSMPGGSPYDSRHPSAVRQGGSVHESVSSRPRRRLALLPWVLGAGASILLGMGLVLALAPDRDKSTVSDGEPPGDPTLVENEGADQVEAPPGDDQPVSEDTPDAPGERTAPPAGGVTDASPEAGQQDDGDDGAQGQEMAGLDGEAEDIPIEMDPVDVEPPEVFKIKLILEPATATVVVNGAVRTENPLELEAREKAYRIQVRAKGFEPKKRWLRAERDRTLKIELEPMGLDL